MASRTLLLVIALGLVAAACVPKGGEATTTVGTDVTTTTAGEDTPTTTSTLVSEELVAPERGDPDDAASDAFWDAGEFDIADEPSQFDEDALVAIERWLPEDLVAGLVWEVFTGEAGTTVLTVSVIPTLTWRGDPNFVPALIATLSDGDAEEVEDGIFRAVTAGGLVMFAQSTGDGFLISTSIVTEAAVAYLKALAAETQPHGVWESGACLYIDPAIETLPYAPFPPDIVVPCDGPHNAEVLISEQIGTDLQAFDASSIEYDRSYRCDMAYAEVFGAQKDHTPTLITYMPDADEWDRGDRYLACVVQIDSLDGLELTAGPMSDRSDLDWAPQPEACLDRSFAPETVACSRPHGYQYLGDATVPFDTWPEEGTIAFQNACVSLLDDFVQDGPASVDVFATGLHPYAFELGDRTVRCMAFATEDDLLVDIAGSFSEVWRVIGSGGIAA